METNFKTYIGTKTIKAMPMGAGEAQRLGAKITDDTVKDNIGNDGYLVEYPDGYRSWSPAKAFEAAYKVAESPTDHMLIELTDLGNRITEATKQLFGPVPRMSSFERDALSDQVCAMQLYFKRLLARYQTEISKMEIDDLEFEEID